MEPTEAATNGTFEGLGYQQQEYQEHAYEEQTESYQPMEFAAQEQPVETPAVDFQIPVVEEDNELTYVAEQRCSWKDIQGFLTVLFLLLCSKFMREYEEKIALKAQEQEKVAVECKAKAEEDMAQFVAERQRIKESKMQSNRVFEQATLEKMVADLQNENPWERVVTLVDLETSRKKKLDALNNKKDSKKQDPKPVAVPAKKTPEDEEDVSRMRQLFVQLKATPLEQTRADAVAAN